MASSPDRTRIKSAITNMTKKRRIGHIGIACAIFLSVFFAGSITGITPTEAKIILTAMALQTEALAESIDPWFIAIHNITISLPMFIPALGFIWGAFAGYQTGLLISAIAITTDGFESWMGMLLFITPVGIIELSAYGLAMSRSWLFGRTLLKKKYRTKDNIKSMMKITLIEILIVATLLVIGGYIEAWMITEFGSQSLDILNKYR